MLSKKCSYLGRISTRMHYKKIMYSNNNHPSQTSEYLPFLAGHNAADEGAKEWHVLPGRVRGKAETGEPRVWREICQASPRPRHGPHASVHPLGKVSSQYFVASVSPSLLCLHSFTCHPRSKNLTWISFTYNFIFTLIHLVSRDQRIYHEYLLHIIFFSIIGYVVTSLWAS